MSLSYWRDNKTYKLLLLCSKRDLTRYFLYRSPCVKDHDSLFICVYILSIFSICFLSKLKVERLWFLEHYGEIRPKSKRLIPIDDIDLSVVLETVNCINSK